MKKTRSAKPFAKKSFGQNFLIDDNYIRQIIHALNPQAGETIIEIGAGRGALTAELVEKDVTVIAIELDNDLIPLLDLTFGRFERFQLVKNDALKVDFREIIGKYSRQNEIRPTKLVANLPYNISTAILQYLIEYRDCFSDLVLMLQKEVVGRITAGIGNRERGFLTVLIEAYFESEKLFEVPPKAFRPVPKVQSAVIRLKPKEKILFKDADLFRKIISAGFRQKRKTILNNLKNAEDLFAENNLVAILEKAGIDPKSRAEDLKLEEWVQLVR